MKLFITGASGLLGSNLSFACAKNSHEVLAAYHEHAVTISGCSAIKLNLLSSNFEAVKKFKPDCIIHCAALTNVDLCQENPALAHSVNVEATEKIVELVKELPSRLLFISTDALFDGKKSFHSETERPNPLNVYAETKVLAENVVKTLVDYAIIRTNFYGFNIVGKQSFSEWLHHRLSQGEKVPAFSDFFFSPIEATSLCAALLELASSDFNGVLNVAGDCRLSKHDFALEFAREFGFDSSLVKPTKMSEALLKARRPSDCSLDVSKAKKVLKTKLPGVKNGVRSYKNLFEQGYADKLRGFSNG